MTPRTTGPRLAALALAGALLAAPGARAAAQVGYTPEQSPFRDLNVTQEVTAFAGWYAAKRDPAGVAPGSGPLAGLRYERHLGGPAFIIGELSAASIERTVVDPTKPAATRVVGSQSGPLVFSNVDLGLSLTGSRSYHRLVPVIHGGAGVVTDLRGRRDVGGFLFGTRFAITAGGGIRWVPTGRLSLRADVTDHLFRIAYPNTYFVPASDNSTVLTVKQGRSAWTHNAALSLGVSYLFLR